MWIYSLAFSKKKNKENILASASNDGIVKIWNLEYEN